MKTALFLIMTTLGASTAHAAAPVTLDFEAFEPGRTPAGFSTALTGGGGPVSWIIQEDQTAPSGGRVLAQTSADGTSFRFPLCVYDNFRAKDVVVSVKFKPLSGKVDQAAGIVWRYQDKDNYYIVRANALEDNVVLYKVENGKRTDLKPVGAGLFAYGKKTSVPSGQWSELRVAAEGNRFEVSVNGDSLFAVEDNTFTESGKVGLWTKADSVTLFDDLQIVGDEAE
ncbi:MAG: family 16 glycoside hydrolase [Thermodesulfobacteriota bacterium]